MYPSLETFFIDSFDETGIQKFFYWIRDVDVRLGPGGGGYLSQLDL
jgi:hypothetical protein